MSEKEKKGAAGAQVAPAMGPPGLIAKEDIPAVLPILPLRNSVFFPGGVLPLAVGRQKTIALIKDAVRDEQVIGVVTQRRAEEEDPGAAMPREFLILCCGRARCRQNRIAPSTVLGELLVLKQQRRPRAPQMPFHVVRQQAQENMRRHAILAAMPNRSDQQVHAFQGAESPLHLGQALVAAHCIGSR